MTLSSNITVLIDLFSEKGYIFFTLLGEHYLRLENEFEMFREYNEYEEALEYYFYLEILGQYLLNWSLGFEAPIGYETLTFANITAHIGAFPVELEMACEVNNVTEAEEEIEVEASVDVYLNFDLTIIVNTSVTGDVNVTGATTEPDVYQLLWINEGWKDVIIPINETQQLMILSALM